MRSRAHLAEAAIAAGLVAIGLAVAAQTYTLPETAGYARVGPGLFPALIAAGLVACGVLLLREALSGGFRKMPEMTRPPLDWRAFGWVSAGVIAHLIAIGWVGFIVASTILFACVARAFGSRQLLRDVLIGAGLAAVVFVVFTQGLGLALPSGLPKG